MRTIGSSVIGLAVIISLAACSGDPNAAADPASPPTATISSVPPTTPEPSATPSSPTPPQGPKQFVRAWVTTLNSAMSTGDTADLKPLSSRECINCNRIIHLIDDIYTQGGFIKSRGWRVTNVVVDSENPRTLVVSFTVRTPPEAVRHTSTSKVEHKPGGKAGFTFWLGRPRIGPIVTRMDPLT